MCLYDTKNDDIFVKNGIYVHAQDGIINSDMPGRSVCVCVRARVCMYPVCVCVYARHKENSYQMHSCFIIHIHTYLHTHIH